ncbi:MAG: mismatch repair protein [Terracidiphilus sp.]
MDSFAGSPGNESPRAVYGHLLSENQARLFSHRRRDKLFVGAKIAIAVAAVGMMLLYLHAGHGIWMLGMAFAVFVALALLHERVLRSIRDVKAVIAFYERGIARLEDRWAGTGESGERFLDATHPYARDLDIFGKGSIFELLCTCRTRAGEEMLARWLLEAAPPDEIRARQAAGDDLRNRTRFREKLFTAGHRVRLGVHPDALTAWGENEQRFGSQWFSVLAAALAVLWIAAGVYGLARGSYDIFLLLSLINLGVSRWRRQGLHASADAIDAAAADLGLLAQVLEILERESFTSPRLKDLQAELKTDGIPPSAAVKKLDRIAHYLESRRNLLVRWIDPFVFYSAQLTMMAEAWRRKFGPAIRGWLAAVGEMETLAALGGHAFEHPDDCWPEFVDRSPCFDAQAFAHPLMPEGKAIPNELNLDDELQLIVLSGPNMAGKSTLVRAIGVNAVLAQCGAPVRASRLRMSSLAVGASICVLDSLQGGVSRFYAEIKRLKLISDLAQGPVPVLFLLDELLAGTNSHDRLAGTEYVVSDLVQHGAIGMITTHDLALARIPESMNGQTRNYHFEDHLEDGELRFDYKLKAGVVQTSNALKLMQSIGLLRE